jgi:hypothetical protein
MLFNAIPDAVIELSSEHTNSLIKLLGSMRGAA